MIKSIFGFKSSDTVEALPVASLAQEVAAVPEALEQVTAEVVREENQKNKEADQTPVHPELKVSNNQPKDPTPRNYRPLQTCQTIAIVNQKGGCGKTITAINLAACLTKKGQRVLIVDMDPQAHATLGLSVKPSDSAKTIYEVLVEQDTAAAVAIHPTKLEKLSIIPGNTRLNSAQVDLLSWNERERVLNPLGFSSA